jgi:hypothetical protein
MRPSKTVSPFSSLNQVRGERWVFLKNYLCQQAALAKQSVFPLQCNGNGGLPQFKKKAGHEKETKLHKKLLETKGGPSNEGNQVKWCIHAVPSSAFKPI